MIVISASLTACASGHSSLKSSLLGSPAEDVKRILIISNVKGEYFNALMYEGLMARLTTDLSACGIRLGIGHVPTRATNLSEFLTSTLFEYKPDAFLTIVRLDATVDQGYRANVNASWTFALEMASAKTRIGIWSATYTTQVLSGNTFVDDRRSGEKIGSEIASAIKADKAIVGCK